MNRAQLNERLKAVGISQAALCRAVGYGASAATHWRDRVPMHIESYVIALETLDPVGRVDALHKAAIAQMERDG